jgi:hypothetical protein
MFTETLTERFAFVGYIPPTNHTANTDNSIAGIDMSNIRRLMCIVAEGVNPGSYNLYFQASANANMAGPSNVAGSVPVNTNAANTISTLEIRADQLPAGTRYVQPVPQFTTAGHFVTVICLGDECHYKPGNQFTIANTVTVQAVT